MLRGARQCRKHMEYPWHPLESRLYLIVISSILALTSKSPVNLSISFRPNDPTPLMNFSSHQRGRVFAGPACIASATWYGPNSTLCSASLRAITYISTSKPSTLGWYIIVMRKACSCWSIVAAWTFLASSI
jgi:hypothetical protein